MHPSKIIVALDVETWTELKQLVEQLAPDLCRVKVGKELFTRYGPEVVHYLHQCGFEVFLDLKFHDIPTTVYKAVRAAAELKVWMVNVHASGGLSMLKHARQAIQDSSHQPLLIAVTILTSLSEEEVAAIGYQRPLTEQVIHLAKLAELANLDGVVCSAAEVQQIKHQVSPRLLTVTPGIRLALAANDDQTRIMTPAAALEAGADYLVIGRPITRAISPLQVLKQLNDSL